ncbi:hypothetical protein D3C76_1336830 [compost metagenome]
MHFKAGKFFRQGFKAFDNRLVRHGLVLCQAQASFLAAHHRQRPAIEALALAQHFTRFFQQSVAGLGEFRLATAAAIEQVHAQVFLQQCNRAANRRLGFALVPCHGRKRTLLRHTDEKPQLFKIPLHRANPSSEQIGNDFTASGESLECRTQQATLHTRIDP